jgi:ABC-type transport system involved in cytochrome bd biosynthesis fused ATPase/permease subunit
LRVRFEATDSFLACSTIIDMDWIIVLDHGEIIEQGKPQKLLQKSDGAFKRLAGEEIDIYRKPSIARAE